MDTQPSPRILVYAPSLRRGAPNQRLAALAARGLRAAGAQVTLLAPGEEAVALYRSASGPAPAEASALHAQLRRHDGVFIATPADNVATRPLLVNVLDWVSRVTANGGMAAAFGGPVFALGSASNGELGGSRELAVVRHLLELGLSACVIPAMVSVPEGGFDINGALHGVYGASLDRMLAGLLAACNAREEAITN